MKKISSQLKKFQYFYPYTVALVGARSEAQTNFMSCAWHTALSFEPPLFGVLVSKKRFTHQLISKAREFTVNFLAFQTVKLAAQMGRRSAYDMDKLKEFQVKLAPSTVIQSPVIEEAYVSFECKLAEIRAFGDHDLFAGEVLAVHEREKCFNVEGVLNVRKISPLLYLGNDFYITINPDALQHVVPD